MHFHSYFFLSFLFFSSLGFFFSSFLTTFSLPIVYSLPYDFLRDVCFHNSIFLSLRQVLRVLEINNHGTPIAKIGYNEGVYYIRTLILSTKEIVHET